VKLNNSEFENAKFWFVTKTLGQIKIIRDISLRKTEIDEKKIKKIESLIKSYIPGGFRSLINLKTTIGEQIGQHMQLTILAMAIDLNQEAFDSRNKKGMIIL